jgi:hypothetical protein
MWVISMPLAVIVAWLLESVGGVYVLDKYITNPKMRHWLVRLVNYSLLSRGTMMKQIYISGIRLRSLLRIRTRYSPYRPPKVYAKRIARPPGATLLYIVDFLYKAKIVEETFKPIVADWRTEYFEALKQGRRLKASWISVRYRFSFIFAMGMSKLFSFFKSFISAGK